MNASELSTLVAESAALRRRQTLQPVEGKGGKIFPPTYPGEGRNGPRHVFERRRIDGKDVWCVLVDSVQSQANRMEESLRALIDAGELFIPHVVVDFSGKGLAGLEKITSLDAPHRVYDAIFRDSLLDGEPFMKSATGQRLAKASLVDASALLEISPTALLFGAWHSTGEGGGLGAKFARCLVSEIVGVGVPVEVPELVRERKDSSYLISSGEASSAGRRTGSRIDPLGVLRKVEIYKRAGEQDWTARAELAEKDGKGNPVKYKRKGKEKGAGTPAAINHGNIRPSSEALGVTCDHLEHSFVLSFAALRRLRFGRDKKRDAAGRGFLAALGLLASVEQDAWGYALRSRCNLVPEGPKHMEIVHADGTSESLNLNRDDVHELYTQVYAEAKAAGFDLRETPLELEPQPKLLDIVKLSQDKALAGDGGEDGETGDE